MNNTRNIAVILSGGHGSRSGLDYPKQFLKIAGREVLAHTVEAFQKHRGIHEIAIVVNHAYLERVEDMVRQYKWSKVKRVLNGGSERYESSQSAIGAYKNEPDVNLIFHDAVRPLVSVQTIDRVIDALRTHEAVDTVIPSSDTIVQVDDSGEFIQAIPDRRRLRRGQTPQAFRFDVIEQAYKLASLSTGVSFSDDCGVVNQFLPDVKIKVVMGEEANMKLTHPEDIYLLEKLFQVKTSVPLESDQLSSLEGKVGVVFGGSYGIGKEVVEKLNALGAVAHSFSRSGEGVDIRDKDAIDKALKGVWRDHGQIDYVICTAAILRKEPLMHMAPEVISEVIDVNFHGMINVSIAAKPYLQSTGGHLLHFTSSSYTRGRADYSVYSATKAGVVNFVQAIAQEWEHLNIKVNCINPARTRTPMRLENFGVEPEGTLLEASVVADEVLRVLAGNATGQVFDIKNE